MNVVVENDKEENETDQNEGDKEAKEVDQKSDGDNENDSNDDDDDCCDRLTPFPEKSCAKQVEEDAVSKMSFIMREKLLVLAGNLRRRTSQVRTKRGIKK